MSDEDVVINRRTRSFEGYMSVDVYRLRHRNFEDGWTGEMEREVLERGHAVAVLPYDPRRQEVVLIEQFRIGAYTAPNYPAWQIECVAGMIDAGHTAEDTAIRETKEETGADVLSLYPIVNYLSSPGATSESIQMFAGHVNSTNVGGVFGLAHEHEFIRVFTVPKKDAFEMVRDGTIGNGMTIIALQWLELHHAELSEAWSETT